MEETIRNNLGNPQQLEVLFRANRTSFMRSFNLLYPEIKDNSAAQVWHARINFDNQTLSWGSLLEVVGVFILAAIAGLIAKIPDWAQINQEYFYSRNVGFIIFPALIAYFSWKQNVLPKNLIVLLFTLLLAVFYINWFPATDGSDTLLLSCIHVPFFLWAITGYAFGGYKLNNLAARLDFLKFNGDLLVMMAVLVLAGGLMAGLTFGLFELIEMNIEQFFTKYILIFGLPAVPIFATYLVQTNPQLVSKVSPVIAKVFTPLVVVMLLVYLTAIVYTGKDPFNDREFLLLFNLLLIGVMAIILFAVVGNTRNSQSKLSILLLVTLAILAVIVNGIALSAILFRISEWGFTPNRIAVLGSNLLILTNLLLVLIRLLKSIRNSGEIVSVENCIATFLPVYWIWTFLIVFVLPVLFGFA